MSHLCHAWMSHVAFMSHVNESCRIHVTREWVMSHSRHTWMSHVTNLTFGILHFTSEWVMPQSCHTCMSHVTATSCVHESRRSHMWMSHVAHLIFGISHVTHEYVHLIFDVPTMTTCIKLQVSFAKEPYKRDYLIFGISHVTHEYVITLTSRVHESCHSHVTHEWVMPQTSSSAYVVSHIITLISRVHESCHSHVTHEWVTSRVNASCCCHTHMIHVAHLIVWYMSTRHVPTMRSTDMYHVPTMTTCIKLQVSFAKEPYKRDYILQKRPETCLALSLIMSRETHTHTHTHLTCTMYQRWPHIFGTCRLNNTFRLQSIALQV